MGTIAILTIVFLALMLGYTIGGDMRYIGSGMFRTLMWLSAVGLGAFLGARMGESLASASYEWAGALIGVLASVAGTALSYSRRKKT